MCVCICVPPFFGLNVVVVVVGEGGLHFQLTY